jgi:hypothetical protein
MKLSENQAFQVFKLIKGFLQRDTKVDEQDADFIMLELINKELKE